MNKYTTILLDIDQTILDFNKAEKYALYKILKTLNIKPNKTILNIYHNIDMKWWKKFELNEVTKQELLENRFKEFFNLLDKNLNIDVTMINKDYLYYLGDKVFYIKDSRKFVKRLHKKYKILVITNGVYDTQMRRLNKTKLLKYFDKIYVSEKLGFKKPQKEFFDYILKENKLTNTECIIIGDSISSDIMGGINSSIDTCLFNSIDTRNIATYRIKKLIDFFKKVK